MRGRFFTASEDKVGARVTIIGGGIKDAFFGDEDAIGKYIKIDNLKFRVVGVLEKQGKFLGLFSVDKQAILLRQRNTKIEVIQNVTRSYYGLLQDQQLLEVAEKNLVLSEKQVDLVQKQFDLGAVRKTDLLKAKVSIGQARVELLNRKTALDNSRRQLFNDD